MPRTLFPFLSFVILATLGAGVFWQSPQRPQSRDSFRPVPPAGEALATFAGGCFWCMEPPFEGLHGVRSVFSGYTGGKEKDPKYKDVSAGRTGHTEAVQITFNPEVISYETLLAIFWRSLDPTDAGGQFADQGRQYRPGIFVHNDAQRAAAERSKKALAESKRFAKPLVVPIQDYDVFYPAEGYHQDYYRTNPKQYKSYRRGSGREGFLQEVWGAVPPVDHPRYSKPAPGVIKERLDPLKFKVTQQNGTEPPFKNAYWENKRAGIYVDIVSGEPLFASQDKFKSGTGWPSFIRSLVEGNILFVKDRSLGSVRTEVRSKHGDSHLGHVFDDGPAPTGLRYCINSASLRFIPVEELAKKGYAEFAKAFEKEAGKDRR